MTNLTKYTDKSYPIDVWIYPLKPVKQYFVYNALLPDTNQEPRKGKLIGIVSGEKTIVVDQFKDHHNEYGQFGFMSYPTPIKVDCDFGHVLFDGNQTEKIPMAQISFNYIKPLWNELLDDYGLLAAVDTMIKIASKNIENETYDRAVIADQRLDRMIDKMEDRFNDRLATFLTDAYSPLSHWGKNYQHSRKDVIKWTKLRIETKTQFDHAKPM